MVLLRTLAITAIIVGLITFAGGIYGVWGTGHNWQYSCGVPPSGAAATEDNPHHSFRMTALPLGVTCIWWMLDGSTVEVPPRDLTLSFVVYGAMATVATAIATLVLTRKRPKTAVAR